MGAKGFIKNWASKSYLHWVKKFLVPKAGLYRLWQSVGQKWCVENIKVSGNELEVGGWAIVPPEQRERAEFTWNGKAFDQIQFPLSRPDVGSVFSYVPAASESGFVCRARRQFTGNRREEFLTFRCMDRESGKPLFGDDFPYYYFFPKDNEPFPDPVRRRRVHGNDQEDNFRIVGSTVLMRLRSALQNILGRDLGDFQSILDWGCGCGRVTRYLATAAPRTVTGVDVDKDNIRWCREHLPLAEFHDIPLLTPTSLISASFDLVIGISVFTHLPEKQQFQWLDELHRLAKPGAILLLTFHGDATICMMNLTEAQLLTRNQKGILDAPYAIRDPNLPGTDYYRNTFHATSYIRRHWSPYFQILKIIPGFVGDQDLAILRKNDPRH